MTTQQLRITVNKKLSDVSCNNRIEKSALRIKYPNLYKALGTIAGASDKSIHGYIEDLGYRYY
jgi:hypothetical protein